MFDNFVILVLENEVFRLFTTLIKAIFGHNII